MLRAFDLALFDYHVKPNNKDSTSFSQIVSF